MKLDILAAFANALALRSMGKVHGEGSVEKAFQEVLAFPQDEKQRIWAVLTDPYWETAFLGEANYELYFTSLLLLGATSSQSLATRLFASFVTRIFANTAPALDVVLSSYSQLCGHDLFSANCIRMDALGEACKKVCKCNAFPRYRMLFFSAEQRRRRRQGTLSAECTPQVNLFIDLVRELVNFNLFEEAARQLKQGASLESVLCDVLLVNTEWHRMLIGRDVVMLCRGDMPDLAARAGFTLEDNDFVGGGARKFLYSIELGSAASSFAVSSASSDGERLRLVHAALLPLLKWRRWIAPLGWTLSHTEDLLCELRKWMLRATPRRHRASGRVRCQVDRNRILSSCHTSFAVSSEGALLMSHAWQCSTSRKSEQSTGSGCSSFGMRSL